MIGTLPLSIVTLLAYLFGAWMFYLAVGAGTGIQYLVVSGVFFTCGTVAFAGLAIVQTMSKLRSASDQRQPS